MTIWLGLLFGFRVIRAFETSRRGALKAMASSSILASASIASDALMEGFLQKTIGNDDQRGTRYLWTDAFAVCNLLASIAARTTASIWTMLFLW